MTKVHPNATTVGSVSPKPPTKPCLESKSLVLTVWKKSLLFNCDGFTVFDANGDLVFRVDNYISGNKGEIILMDATGNSLLTIRRKRLSLSDQWLVFEGEEAAKPQLSVRKKANLLSSRSLAQVSSLLSGKKKKNLMYEIEGSFQQRRCAVYDEKRRLVSEMRRKEAMGGKVALGPDVFHLVVYEPYIDSSTAMAIVILLDQMFESSTHNRRFSFATSFNY